MCGIIGFVGKKNIRQLSDMLLSVEHRGRDGNALFYSNHVHMGMNRLAIVDMSPNLYPMKYQKYTLVFNGEIYNYQELRKDLIKKGVRFKSYCDAEVILPLFARFGYKAFSKLEGMFAICIYDEIGGRIILARDKSGEKPLYYSNGPSGFAFGSEIKALMSLGQTKSSVDQKSMCQYLTQGFIFSPDTMVKDIKKVPPSSCIMYHVASKKIQNKTYWRPDRFLHPAADAKEESVCVHRLDVLLRKSVKQRLMADVPVGCFLSGGVDSSLIALFAAQNRPGINTYSVSFPGLLRYDESRFASFVSERLNTSHQIIRCVPDDVRPLIEHLGKLIDEPIVDPAILPTMLMAKEARKKVKVVLTGEGADELFGGYYRYHKHLIVEKVYSLLHGHPGAVRAWNTLFRGRLTGATERLADRYYAQHIWRPQELSNLLMHNDFAFPRHDYLQRYADAKPLLSMQLTDYRGYMAEQLLMKIDKSTMAFNLEARAPYLDSQIAVFAFGLPNEMKIRNIHGKYILKKVAERYFPKPLVWRPKHGFSLPLGLWFQKELRDCVEESFQDIANYSKIFNTRYYRSIIDDHLSRKIDHSNKIWSIMVLSKWMKYHGISV